MPRASLGDLDFKKCLFHELRQPGGVHRAVRGRAVLPGQGRCGQQAALQQREMRGVGERVRAVAALLRVFSLRAFGTSKANGDDGKGGLLELFGGARVLIAPCPSPSLAGNKREERRCSEHAAGGAEKARQKAESGV